MAVFRTFSFETPLLTQDVNQLTDDNGPFRNKTVFLIFVSQKGGKADAAVL
jgi:hypothetical protein